ncbi:MAG TPA: ATP-grasp domain-containing protein [Candidatus Acidoferrum sp.]|nr:ATP-grasp domain-containing protein [Candidatus Acidoferrum sp.]
MSLRSDVPGAKEGLQVAAPGALVMGADYRALGVVRSLGRKKIPVWLINQGGHHVAAVSRFVTRRVRWPVAHQAAQIEFLLELGFQNNLNGWALIPTDDYAVALLAHHHKILQQIYRVTIPPWEQIRWLCDKRLLSCLAQKLSIHQPFQACPANREQLARIDCPFPVILKPALRLQPTSLSIPKAWPAVDRKTLLAQFDAASSVIAPENLIVQETVPGGGENQFSFAALCRDGSPLAWMVARRTRQYPKDFGQFSTFVETVDEPQIIEPATRLLAELRFTGLAEVEFKYDCRDGRFKLLDVNPRVWGWHTLSRRVGIDFPYLLWRLVNGKTVPILFGRAGERWMHATGDLRVAIGEILRGNLPLPQYLRTFLPSTESPIFAWDDPLPGFLDLPLFMYTFGKRLLSSVA